MSIYDHTRPINDGDIKKAKTFYDIVCWGGLLIVLLPVGIANIILGYMMGDSPCTLCWGQRQQMAALYGALWLQAQIPRHDARDGRLRFIFELPSLGQSRHA